MAQRIPPFIFNWAGALDPAVDLIQGSTPPPRLEYLAAVNARLQAAVLNPYAGVGLNTNFERGSGGVWLALQIVNAATSAMRGKYTRSNGVAKAAPDTIDVTATSSGAGATDHIVIPSPFSTGSDRMSTATWGTIQVVSGSEDTDAMPAAAEDRMFESPTLTSLGAPAVEQFQVLHCLGFCVVPYMVGDIAVL